jgi:predicted dehydrogenase
MTADFRFEGGATGRVTASMWSSDVLKVGARVVAERGEMRVVNFVAPQIFNRLKVRTEGRTSRERVPGDPTYTYQLRAFAAAVRGEDTNLTPPRDAVVTMGLIDDVYRAAGLHPRGA